MHFCYKLRVYLWKKSGTRLGNVSGLIKGLMLAFPVLHMVWERRPQSSPGILGEPRPAGSIQTAFPTTTTTAAPDRQTDKCAHVLDWRTWPRPLLAEDSGCQPADNKLMDNHFMTNRLQTAAARHPWRRSPVWTFSSRGNQTALGSWHNCTCSLDIFLMVLLEQSS